MLAGWAHLLKTAIVQRVYFWLIPIQGIAPAHSNRSSAVSKGNHYKLQQTDT